MDELWNTVAEMMFEWNAYPDQPRAVRHALVNIKQDAIDQKEESVQRTKTIMLCNIAIRQHDQLFPEAVV